jgi:hypothetical protein
MSRSILSLLCICIGKNTIAGRFDSAEVGRLSDLPSFLHNVETVE